MAWYRRRRADMRQANVMLSYPIDEAEELLSTKLKAAKTSLANCEEDLDFLREQITVRWVGLRWSRWMLMCFGADYGGGGCEGVQLGRGTKEKRKGRGGETKGHKERKGWGTGRLKRSSQATWLLAH